MSIEGRALKVMIATVAIVSTVLGCNPTRKPVPVVSSATDTEKATSKKPYTITLTDFTQQSGIDFIHYYDKDGERYIIETVGGALASLDFDLDGWMDVYFLNGSVLPNNGEDVSPNCLYRNLEDYRFQNVTAPANCGAEEFGMGVAVADYDNDGFPDLFVNNFGPNKLYKNNGDGTFTDTAEHAGVSVPDRLGAGATFFDANRDGNLDLYVANYVKAPIDAHVQRTTDGYPSYPAPSDFHGENDLFFLSLGDGTFVDRTIESGIGDIALTSMGVVAADLDDDGDDDLVIVTDVNRNLLYRNDGTGHFEETGIQSGIAFSKEGRRNGNMGVDVGDYNNDGSLDLYTTTFSNELPVLYRNDGSAGFEDVTQQSGSGKGLFPHANWGLAFLDLENDRDKDLFVANGHTDPKVASWSYTTSWKVLNTVYANDGMGQFTNVTSLCGNGLSPVESSRGMVVEDFDNDGDQDIILSNSLAAPTVLRNDSAPQGHWLQLKLVGQKDARDGVGARATVKTTSGILVDQVVSGRGYQSSFGNRLHFGLGADTEVLEITIRWTNGTLQKIEPKSIDTCIKILQQSN